MKNPLLEKNQSNVISIVKTEIKGIGRGIFESLC
jgi:hypothetical protein